MGADSSQLHNLIVTVQHVSLLFVVNDCTNDLVISLYLNIQTSLSTETQVSPDQAAIRALHSSPLFTNLGRQDVAVRVTVSSQSMLYQHVYVRLSVRHHTKMIVKSGAPDVLYPQPVNPSLQGDNGSLWRHKIRGAASPGIPTGRPEQL